MMRPSVALFSFILWWVSFANVAQATAERAPALVVVGDSLSAGYGIPQGQEWVTLFQQKLTRAQVPVRVVNASISGDTTAGGLARLPALLAREQPRWVLIELGGNDGLRGMSLKAMRTNLTQMVTLAQASGAEVFLAGIKIPPNYGNKYRTRFEAVFETVASEQSVPLLPFLLDGVGGVDQLMQADRIHPNTEAQPVIADNVWAFLKPALLPE